jgi:hypothetical protein
VSGDQLAIVIVTVASIVGILGGGLIGGLTGRLNARPRDYECARCGYTGRVGEPVPAQHPTDCHLCGGHPQPGHTCPECGRYDAGSS